MEYLIIGTIVFIVISMLMLVAGMITGSDGLASAGGVFAFLSLILIVACIIFGMSWKAAEIKSSVINREYGTSYTQEEIFYADSVIDTIRQIDRTRIELNGKLIEEKK